VNSNFQTVFWPKAGIVCVLGKKGVRSRRATFAPLFSETGGAGDRFALFSGKACRIRVKAYAPPLPISVPEPSTFALTARGLLGTTLAAGSSQWPRQSIGKATTGDVNFSLQSFT